MHYPIQELHYQNGKIIKQDPGIINVKSNMAFILHIFYIDIWEEELFPYLNKIKLPHDIYITVPHTMENEQIKQILKNAPHITVYQTQNRGRDILPFLQIMNIIGTDKYKYICKLHTKKSAGRDLGTVWRKLLYFDLIGSNGTVSNIIDMFEEDKDIGMITGKNTILDAQKYYLNNKIKTDRLLTLLNLTVKKNYQFAGGTMFWVKPLLLEPLINLYRTGELVFEEELGQMDNTLAHAIERILGIFCHINNQKIIGSPALYTQLTDTTLNEVAALVLSQTYVGEDMFLHMRNNILYKDSLIEDKTKEIIAAHKEMAKRDKEIIKTHTSLSETLSLLKEKDIQIEQKNIQIEFLNSLTLSRRIKQRIKKIIPNRLLILLGFSPYEELTLPHA